jgi:phage protein D
MFNYIKVNFPDSDIQPEVVYSATISQSRFAHEIAVVKFRDWNVEYDIVAPGTPVQLTLYGMKNRKEFYGYVHHITSDQTPGKNFTEVTIIGASFPMKQQAQTIYKNTTADQVIQAIATKYNFVAYTVPHPRVYPQVSQAGHTDWEFMVRLAMQSGYSLRTENTELYFQPVMEDFTNYRESAPKFIMRQATDPDGSTIYSFNPIIGESVSFKDTTKSAVAISGVNQNDGTRMAITTQIRNIKTRKKQKTEFFDQFDTSVVAPDIETATSEAKAAEDKNYFPYRATVEVLGDPTLRPDLPVFLEGIGDNYSGYWVILKTEHKILETERNQQTYTTVLTVGIDSLGSAASWSDNKTVNSPDYTPRRKIIPGVKQTKVVPATALSTVSPAVSPQLKNSFGTLQNRSKPGTNRRDQAPTIWKSTTSSLNNIIVETKKSPIILDRILKRAASNL